ncbi:MAG: type III-A CRISPR-associated RAMP protein Csm5 [Bacillota bacterium]|nr:MAG: type III-A CRISPR-associated RAMP protein Csm5 [Bacillota bacterium]
MGSLFRYEAEILSPLHIGSGDSSRSFEYLVENNTVAFIDVWKLLNANKNNRGFIDSFYRLIGEEGRFSWDEVLKYAPKVQLKDFISYEVDILGAQQVGNEIISFIKTAGRPYIPGSSLKGAFRAALLRGIWDAVENRYKKRLEEALGDKDVTLKELDDFSEKELFGKPHYSPFKLVRFSDSLPLSQKELGICEMKILNICSGKRKWFNSPGKNVEDSKQARALYLEVLKPGIKVEGVFEIDSKNKTGNVSKNVRNQWILECAFQNIRRDVEDYIEEEKEFYAKYGLYELEQFYQELQERSRGLEENELLLQMGFGTGYLSKTVGRFFDKDDFEKLSRKGMRVSDYNLFPKTRRIIFSGGNPVSVPGWIKITFGRTAESVEIKV